VRSSYDVVKPYDTRLGQLQRGRGAGTRAALADPDSARDELLACIEHDSCQQGEDRGRVYGELLHRLGVPLDGVVAVAGHEDGRLAREVLAAAWLRGYAPVRALLARDDVAQPLLEGVAENVAHWHQTPIDDAPARFAVPLARWQAEWRALSCRPRLSLDGTESIDTLLTLAVVARRQEDAERLADALLRAVTTADHGMLAHTAEHDVEPARAAMAARVLGHRGDERLLATAERAFAWPDDFDDPTRRLSSRDRLRRLAMVRYVTALPATCTLPLARRWRACDDIRGGVAGRIFALHAEPTDREHLEAVVRALGDMGDHCADEIAALARLRDARSVPVLVAAVERTPSSYLRVHALRALVAMPGEQGMAPCLGEALWDSEDAAAAIACASLRDIDAAARQRLDELAADPVATPELRAAAADRIAAG
jgi:hypothetical protein